MGYKGVEFAGQLRQHGAAELAAFLKEAGLKCCGQHVGGNDIATAGSKPYAYAKALGCPYLTTSGAGQVDKGLARRDRAVSQGRRGGQGQRLHIHLP